jgi:LacI family transcriptional regulator
MTVGIVVQDISSPFFSEILRGVDDGLNSTGYASVIVSGHWNASEEAARIKLLLARKVDGLILLSGRIEDKAVLQFATQRPIVATGRSLKSPTAIGFKLDNQNGAYQAVRHLIELGHRRIAFVTGPRIIPMRMNVLPVTNKRWKVQIFRLNPASWSKAISMKPAV